MQTCEVWSAVKFCWYILETTRGTDNVNDYIIFIWITLHCIQWLHNDALLLLTQTMCSKILECDWSSVAKFGCQQDSECIKASLKDSAVSKSCGFIFLQAKVIGRDKFNLWVWCVDWLHDFLLSNSVCNHLPGKQNWFLLLGYPIFFITGHQKGLWTRVKILMRAWICGGILENNI